MNSSRKILDADHACEIVARHLIASAADDISEKYWGEYGTNMSADDWQRIAAWVPELAWYPAAEDYAAAYDFLTDRASRDWPSEVYEP